MDGFAHRSGPAEMFLQYRNCRRRGRCSLGGIHLELESNMRATRFVIAALALCALGAPAARAQSDAFPFGNPKAGKQLYESKCAACHAARFGGDGSRVFTRPDHHIHTAAGLLAQVQACNQGSHAGLSAVDEQSVAAWLDQAYYKLKK